MNWGTRIVLVLGLFVTGIGYMVYVCVKQKDIQLVASDYYEQEIAYQHIIDEKANYNQLINKPSVEQKENLLVLDMSKMNDYKNITGSLYFFRPSQSGMDITKQVTPDAEGKQVIDTEEMNKGKWILKMNLDDGSKKYYNESVIFIQ